MARASAARPGSAGRNAAALSSSRPSSQGSPPPAKVVIKDFTGLSTNIDAADLPEGAARQQVNVVAERVGYFQIRMGFVRVKFRN